MTTSPTPPPLPELDDDRIAAMEHELFARIADEPAPVSTVARARRGRVWLGALGGAAAVAAAVLVVPAVVTGVSAGAGAGSSVAPLTDGSAGSAVAPEVAQDGTFSSGSSGSSDVAAAPADAAAREVIATGSATVRVDDIAAAIALIGQDAAQRGGYVESTSTDAGIPVPIEGSGVTYGTPVTSGPSGYITVRVPSDELADATAALSQVGDVTTSSVSRQDVTQQAVDLRARVESLTASVARLEALVAQAQSVSDVIAVESELSARQADLESYQQQLQYLEGQVSLSSLSVSLVTDAPAVAADPAGFGDGLAAGWNGLVATVNGLVIAVGFLLPWIGIAAVVALVVLLIVRARRRRAAAPVTRTDAPE